MIIFLCKLNSWIVGITHEPPYNEKKKIVNIQKKKITQVMFRYPFSIAKIVYVDD